MVAEIRGDLHVHTCLSPCADYNMMPRSIVIRAKERNLDVIGICDHNSAENVLAVKRAGEMRGLAVIGGMEITSQEEVHMLAFFDDDDNLMEIQNIVYDHLFGTNDQDVFGDQLVVDEDDVIVGFSERLLIGATTLLLEEIVELVHELGGLAIASHVDREAFSIIGQLGFIPEGLSLDGLEISPRESLDAVKERLPQVSDYPLVRSSDAHNLEDIGRVCTSFFARDARVAEISMALSNLDGRKVVIQ